MNSLRGGMQVHAVPESERAIDASGKRLPWGYEYADTELGRRRETEEKGPFGRSTRRRGFSRSKTATPARKEDAVRLENAQNEDAIFNRYMQEQRAKQPLPQSKTDAPLSSADGNAAAAQSSLPDKEPTEVILFGFGEDSQWAAIEYYERISNGLIYEDYDRHPPHQKYDHTISLNRVRAQRGSLSQAALRKRNAYKGGNHWIKVTFDSPEAADLACHCSPHPIHGFLVYAELYRGTPPPSDAPIPYSNAGAQIDTVSLPKSFSTNTLSQDTMTTSPESSHTLSSGTANGRPQKPSFTSLPRSTTTPNLNSNHPFDSLSSTTTAFQQQQQQQQQQAQPPKQRPMRVPGATRAVLLPPEQAFLPAPPRYTGIIGYIMALLFGSSNSSSGKPTSLVNAAAGAGDLIGSTVPRTEDGGFDWKNASLYWLLFAWLDHVFGTDICGIRGDD
ncbi:hypothetical protein AAFC00_003601 [Neodothiora populina]|uniref:Nucleoporin NUP53 n=1 Tax=Neodothiora populina TaxID=2781224 RepID=A0ABR3PEP6_9PEZI